MSNVDQKISDTAKQAKDKISETFSSDSSESQTADQGHLGSSGEPTTGQKISECLHDTKEKPKEKFGQAKDKIPEAGHETKEKANAKYGEVQNTAHKQRDPMQTQAKQQTADRP